MSIARAVSALVRRIETLERAQKQHDRRLNNMFREGVITEVDPATGMAVMDAGGVVTPMSPWLTRAGAIRDWVPVTTGERAVFISPSGNPGQGMILPGGFSDQFPANFDQGGQARRSIGPYSITEGPDGVTFTVGGTTMEFTADGLKVTAGGVVHRFDSEGSIQTGGVKEHDGKNVGSVHTHGGIVRGGANTDPPN